MSLLSCSIPDFYLSDDVIADRHVCGACVRAASFYFLLNFKISVWRHILVCQTGFPYVLVTQNCDFNRRRWSLCWFLGAPFDEIVPFFRRCIHRIRPHRNIAGNLRYHLLFLFSLFYQRLACVTFFGDYHRCRIGLVLYPGTWCNYLIFIFIFILEAINLDAHFLCGRLFLF